MQGARIGPYQVLGDLGSGGMGKVYLAEVAGKVPGLDDGCRVALKIIHPHLLETPGFFKRFLREAEIGRTIEHENVARTYDCDALLHDGVQQNFLVMEYVEGQTLRDLLLELERVPEELCRHIGREVARGLAAIHEAGVIHRDLKPENVLITAEHVVKIMDLGVARLQAEVIRLSQTGAFVGSLEYAAPEQFRSADGEPDGRADLHALGVVLYELATGQHPYRDEDASRVIGRILDDQPRKPGDVNPQLSPFFEEVVQTLIAKEREDRFGSASELAAVLEEGERSAWWQEQAKAIRVQTRRPLRRIRIPRETALYGRDGDLARLHALYEKAKAGDGQVLLLEGEAGIGKTRLVDEFVGRLQQAGEELNFLFGFYPPGGAATAAGAFSTAYREQFGAESLEETLQEYLAATPVLIPSFAALLRGEMTPQSAEPLTKDSMQTVFAHATRALAAERTTIVLIDDLHFAPEDGRALFASLALAVPGHRILLVGTMRHGAPEAWTADVVRLDHVEQLSLARLGPKDLAKLLEDAFHSERLATELGHKIALKCDGNPLFAFGIIGGLREGQLISQTADGAWVTTKVIQDIQVPSSVLDLVHARVADLSEVERDLLDVAACCGFEFDPVLVASALGIGQIPALKRLARIEKKLRLVRSAGSNYTFDHHQVQEALYEGLHERLRQPYHAAIAEALESRERATAEDPKDLDGDLCVQLCGHYLEGGMGEQSLRYLDAALDHLGRGYLNDPAIVLADRALDVPHLLAGTDRLKVLLQKNSRLDLLGRRAAQEPVLAEARALAEASGETEWVATVEGATGQLFGSLGRFQEALAHYERWLELAGEIGHREGEARAMGSLGNVFHALGRYAEAREHFQRWLAIACETGDRQGQARATGSLGNLFNFLGDHRDAREHYEESLAIVREIGDQQGEAAVTANLGNLLYLQGHHERAREHYARWLAIASEIGDRQGEANATGHLGFVLHALGRYAEAREHYERWLAIACEIGDRPGEASAAGSLGTVLLSLGHPEEARVHHERQIAIVREMGDRRGEAHALSSLGWVAEAEGARGTATTLHEQSLALFREIDFPMGTALTLVSLGRLREAGGHTEASRECLEEALALGRKLDEPGTIALATIHLAAFPDGNTAEARSAFERVEDRLKHQEKMECRLLFWKATHHAAHLREAKRLLDYIVEHAPEESRASILTNVRLHREILQEWAEFGDGEE